MFMTVHFLVVNDLIDIPNNKLDVITSIIISGGVKVSKLIEPIEEASINIIKIIEK